MKLHWTIWIPRILLILLILFMGLFSLDVFGEKAPLWKILSGFIIHNIPSLVLLIILLLTWKRPLLGGIFFSVACVLFSLWVAIFFKRYVVTDLLAFSLPMAIGAFMFYLAHCMSKKLNKQKEETASPAPDTQP